MGLTLTLALLVREVLEEELVEGGRELRGGRTLRSGHGAREAGMPEHLVEGHRCLIGGLRGLLQGQLCSLRGPGRD